MRTPPSTDTIHPNASISLGTILAKKLKQSWVEAQKIKSQWKAQKRKEGIAKSSKIEDLVADHQENDAAPESSDEAESEEEVSHAQAQRGTTLSTASEGTSEDEEGSVAGSVNHAMESSVRHAGPPQPKRQQQTHQDHTITHPPSLRDLQREAYSKSSLHTFKSGQRGSDARRGNQTATGHGRGRGGAASPQRGGRGYSRGRGRGQPDMRLRMNAMLEKIKRDYT